MTLHILRRKIVNSLMLIILSVLAFIALFCLGWLFTILIKSGYPGLRWTVLTLNTPPPGSSGGLLNAIVGSLLLSSLAVLMGAPIGILAGVFLSEYQPIGLLSTIVRFIIDILLGAPSIIIGLFIYQIYVIKTGHFSGWAGCFALSIIVIPIVARTTENIYSLVPHTLRESVLALGASQWHLVRFLLIRVIKGAVFTGILLALSRIIGEAAPLIFTALNNQFLSFNMNQPMANLPMTIFNFAMSPYTDWQQLAWTGALLITTWVFALNLLCRLLIKQFKISN
ncbi:phosphate ABC transporter permease PstA [Legionella sp. 27fs60]|uniref:Phosphate transport system permease protein PstA n=2 Tax=Legionella bononiensis TaxID=2793102 RepID=A0ABS1WEF7_9GAMM|nr:phosphate ABC transporter permease PstA [Legionella bononiensis]MBL7527704.1 phosphate ABC transporter permease PstA [Legionella bononiensis]MBL7563613.1 phosphate ABC transporter permease PstA [Legionella bononiensis]